MGRARVPLPLRLTARFHPAGARRDEPNFIKIYLLFQ
jgi:hypothetical protein